MYYIKYEWKSEYPKQKKDTEKKQSNSEKFPQLIPLTAKLGYGKVFLLRKVSNISVPEAGIKSFYTWFFSRDLMARVTFEKNALIRIAWYGIEILRAFPLNSLVSAFLILFYSTD